MALGLEDAPSMGSFFTWTNSSIWSKLDRVLMNNVWSSLDLTCSASFLPMELVSDHYPVITSLVKNFTSGIRPFKFMNMWLDHPSFDDVLRSVWDTWHGGMAHFSLCSKLKALKALLKALNRDELEEGVQAHMDDPLNVTLKLKCHELGECANFLSEAEWSFISQKSRCKFLLEGDRCTKYFHSLIKRDNVRNSISHIVKSDGSCTSSPEEVSILLVDFYKELFGSSKEVHPIVEDVVTNGYILSTADGIFLVAPVLDIEIREALFDIGNEKAPAPDGFSSAFFKSRWDLVEGDVCRAVQEFFVTGVLLKNWNHTILALVPKVSGSPRGAFVQGRNIVDNIWVAQELVKGYNRSRCTLSCMLMMDIRKAFDTVSWSFLEDILRGFGLPELFIGWIMACVEKPTFFISFNGELHGYFEGKRGLRQGDPMSPALFLLCIEYLSRLLKVKIGRDIFSFHPKCQGARITHLTFADDLMLFSYGGYGIC
ncbi:hypothetical protein LIER_03474 [Lithospermum erythrorhizon]|uniref:Reverse transcriptase domain-containing protein n=1 Tax=Lithospermum erythrorhizon TaxID=34254 RepID=A0AAV3NT88_LITER